MLLNGSPLNGGAELNGSEFDLFLKTQSDAVELRDSGRDLFWDVRAGDALTLLDQLVNNSPAGSIVYSRTQSDTIVVTDGIQRFVLRHRRQDDGVTLTDESQRFLLRTRQQSAALAVTDGTIATTYRNRLQGDTVTLTDGTIATAYRNRTQGDVITVADAVSRFLHLTRMLDDSAVITDGLLYTIVGGSVTTRTLSDAFPLYDIGRDFVMEVRTGDTLTPTDGAIASVLTGNVTSVTKTDTVVIFDNEGTFKIFDVLESDETTSVADELSKFRRLHRLAEDALTVLDSAITSLVGGGITYTRTQGDTITLSDGTTRYVLNHRMLEDAAVVADALTTFRRLTRQQSDGAILTDLLGSEVTGSSVTYTQTRSDVINVTDGASLFALRNRQAQSLIVGLFDGTQRHLLKTLLAHDTIDLTDGTVKLRGYVRALVDNVTIFDNALATYVPFIQYTYDVRVRIGRATSGIIFGVDAPIAVGQSPTGIAFGGYN